MNFLAKTPFLRLFACLAIGIVIGEFVGYNFWATLVLCIVGFILLLISQFLHDSVATYRWRNLFGVGLAFLLVSSGLFLHHNFDEKTDLPFNGQNGIYDITLTEQPIEKEHSVMFHAELHYFCDTLDCHKIDGKVILYMAKDSASLALQRGAKLLISTTIDAPHLAGNPEEFDYGTYLRRQGIGGTGYVSAENWRKIGQENHFSILHFADDCRTYLLDIYRRMGLSGNEFGMLAALTLGYKDALTPELRESFSTTGAMHVLAVSGLHVGIIYAVLGWILSLFLPKTKRAERWRSILVILFLWFYAFITGLSPSVLRATVMFSFMAFAGVIGRKSQTYNTIFLSAFLLLLFRPTLLFDVGFQLSYSAVLAIIYFQPKIAGLFYFKNRLARWAWDLTAVSLAAQIGTAPFSIFYFHQFPNYFLLSNFVVIPAATIILYAAVALFITAWIPFLGVAVAWLLNAVLKSMYFLITCIENLPHALSIVWIDTWQLLLLYIVIFGIGFYCYRLNFKNLAFTLVAILAFFGLQTWHHYQAMNTHEVVIFNHSKSLFVNKITPHENLVITLDSTLSQRLASDFWQKIDANAPQFVCDSTLAHKAFTFHNKTFLVLDQNYFRYKTADKKLAVDYLIVNRAVYPSEELFEHILPKTLVTTGDVYPRNNAKFSELATENDVAFYAVRESGALTIKP